MITNRWPDRRFLGIHEREIEAEASAYLVASRAGLITISAGYLSRHAQGADMQKVDVDLIVRAAARIERLAKIRYGSMTFGKRAEQPAKQGSESRQSANAASG